MGNRMILRAFMMALSQIGDPRFRRVLFLGIGLTFALLIGSYAGLLGLVNWMVGDEATVPIFGKVEWLGDLLSFSSFIFMMVMSIFLMMPVASAITSMFLDEVAQAVEDEHYPHLAQVPGVPFGEALRDTLSFLGLLIVANIVALIVGSMLFLIFPPAWVIIFWGLNGFLLGREYFTLAAMRRVGRARAKKLRSKHMGTIWLAGVLMAMPLSVPILNLFIPILGAATFTHIYHILSDKR
jgi:CysZ protein